MKLTSHWPDFVTGKAALMAGGRLARASEVTATRNTFGRRSGGDLQAEALGGVQDEEPDSVGVAQDGVGGRQLAGDFLRLEGALGEAGAVLPFAGNVEVPASVERDHFGQLQAEFHLGDGFLGGASPEKERLENGLRDGLAFLRDGDMGAEGLVDFAGLVEQDADDDAVHGVVRAEEADGFDGFGKGLAEAVHAAFALLQAVGIPGQIVMEGGVEGVLEVDAFTEAVSGDEDAAAFLGQLRHLCPALVVAEQSGDRGDADVVELGAEEALQALGDVVSRGDVAAPDDGIEAFAEKAGDQFGAAGELGVAGRVGDGFGEAREVAEFAAVGLRHGLFGGFDRGRGLAVVGLFVAGLENVLAEIGFLLGLRQGAVAAVQGGDSRRRAGHDAAEQRERGPVADALLALAQRLAGADQLGAELVGFLEEAAVGIGQAVMLVGGDTLGEAVFGFPVFFDVLARALDEVAGQLDALRFGEGGYFVAGELGPEQGEQGAEGFGNAAVGGGREKDKVAGGRGREVLQKVVPLLLVGVGAGGGRGAVRLVHDDEVRAVLDEVGAFAVTLDEVNADDLDGVVAKDAARASGDAAFKLADRAGTDDDGIEAEFLAQLLLPLFAEVRRAEDAERLDFPAIEHFTGDEQSFDRFADADVVGDEHSDGVQAQGHEQRHELVRARADGHARRASGAALRLRAA